MTDYLLFLLYGPMASWGDIAVDERRPTADHPTKSAIFGMIAAALGLRRDQDLEQRQLSHDFGFAIRLDAPGMFMHDFHTSQRPSGQNMRGLPTRRDELAREQKSIITKLSYREYRCDVLATICLWKQVEDASSYSLEDIAEALQSPKFPLYLGRKACPLGLPLVPVQARASTLADALASDAARLLIRRAAEAFSLAERPSTGHPDVAAQLRQYLGPTGPVRVFWEGDRQAFDLDYSLERRDQVDSRSSWQFRTRIEHEGTWPST